MIDGLKFRLKSEDVKKFLQRQVEISSVKAQQLESQLSADQEGDRLGEKEKSILSMFGIKSGPEDVKRKIENAKGRASGMRFMAEHVVDGETYDLDIDELNTIGALE